MRIRFGRWELRPIEGGNWALFELRESSRGKRKGVEDWFHRNRFYQWNTIPNAFLFAANEELMNRDEAQTFQGYADELRRVLASFLEDARRTIEKEPK